VPSPETLNLSGTKNMEFLVLTFVSCLVVIIIARFSMRTRDPHPLSKVLNLGVLIVLVIAGMLTGKHGTSWGLSWWIYYPVPMLLTLIVPMIYFRMDKRESFIYIFLTLISAPLIHIVFSLLGWKNYMPFIKIPSIFELFTA
jgi:hypothetical protein